MTSYRFSKGGLIDRSTALNFSFDGQRMSGHAGDTLASALLANGQLLMGRSFKYHRPRSAVTCGAAEPNALMEIGEGGRLEPNTRATMQELYDGLVSKSQNRWPTLERDFGAINSLASSLFVAGFYYKTFMWPKKFWEAIYEPIIRKAAGLGNLSHEADPDRYEKVYAHCDVLVVGSGPAGLMAALAAARTGARVILADEHARLGGTLLKEREEIAGTAGVTWADGIIAELAAMKNVRLMPRTTVFGAYDDAVFGALERVQKHVAEPDHNAPVEKLWRIITKRCVLAAGAEERPIVFGGNDRPGVMMASAMRAYANQYAVAPGRSAAVFTSTDSGYRTALDLKAHGVHVEVIIDARADAPKLDSGGVPVIRGAVVTDVKGGKHGMSAVEVNGHDFDPVPGAGDVGRLEPGGASGLPARCEAGVERGADMFHAAGERPVDGCRRFGQRQVGVERLPRRWRCGRQHGCSGRGLQGVEGCGSESARRGRLRRVAVVVGEVFDGQGVRRLPERRDRRGPATGGA